MRRWRRRRECGAASVAYGRSAPELAASRCPSRAAVSGRTRTPATCSPAKRARPRRGRRTRQAVRERLARAARARAAPASRSRTVPLEDTSQDGGRGIGPHRTSSIGSRRRAAGGLWSTVGDLLRFAAHQLGGPGPLSAERASRCSRAARRGPRRPILPRLLEPCAGGGRHAFDHEGSVGGYQSLLLLVPEEETALAVLTNSWRGSGLIRRVVRELGLVPAPLEGAAASPHRARPLRARRRRGCPGGAERPLARGGE